MVSEVDRREPPSSSTGDGAIDDQLFALLQPCLEDPTGRALGDLLAAHPHEARALRILYADYHFARSLVGGQRRDRDRALDDLRSVAADSRTYQQLELVARGGMAEVWRTRDRRLGRTLIKKVLPVSLDGAELDVRLVRRLARFLDEARTMSGLQHPAILTVVDFGVDDQGRPFLVMPEVEGHTLVEVLAELRHEQAATAAAVRLVQTLLPACEAIAHAHACGVVHRDLKPSNIMVGRFGEVRVMDWGLAKRIGEPEVQAPEGDADLPASWTRTGDQVGTPAYMAPEQANGDRTAVGPHTDQYALGAILYEGLTGHRPYADQLTETTSTAVLAAIRSAVPTPIHDLAPAVPAELAAIVAKALARAPEDRYPSVSALVDDLRAFLETRVVAAYGSGPWQTLRKWVARNRGLAFGAAGVLVVLIAALTALNLLQDAHRTRLQTTNAALEAARREAVDNFEGQEANLYRHQLASAQRLLQDGESPGAIRVALEKCPPELRGWEWRLLAGALEAPAPLVACDRPIQALAIAEGGGCFAVGTTGDLSVFDLPRTRLRFTHDTGWTSWIETCPLGDRLFWAAQGMVHACTLSSGNLLWSVGLVGRTRGQASIDGHVLYCSADGGQIVVLDGRSGAIRARHQVGADVSQLALQPFGPWLAVAVPERILCLDRTSLEPAHELPGLAGETSFLRFDPLRGFLHAGSESGAYVTLRVPDGALLSAHAMPVRRLFSAKDAIWRNRILRPDRHWLTAFDPGQPGAVLRLSGHTGVVDAIATNSGLDWVLSGCSAGEVRAWRRRQPGGWMTMEGSSLEVLTVRLSPDGSRVAATGWDPRIHVWDTGTGRRLSSLAAWQGAKRALDWTPDGTGIVGVGPDNRFVEWDARSGEVRRPLDLEPGWASRIALAPDGTRLVAVDRGNEVLLVELGTGATRRLGVNCRTAFFAWSPDSASVWVQGTGDVRLFSVADGHELVALATKDASRLEVSPDGGTLFIGDVHGGIHVFDPGTRGLRRLACQEAGVAGIHLVPNEPRMVTSGGDGSIRVIDLRDGTTLLCLIPDQRPLQASDLSGDGRVFVAAGRAGLVTCLRVP